MNTCFHCHKCYGHKSWLTLQDVPVSKEFLPAVKAKEKEKDEENQQQKVNINANICSYLCYRGSRDKFPNKIWPYIANKEDYEGLISPVMMPKKKNRFEFLTHAEIQVLDDTTRDNYYKEKEEFSEFNREISEIHDELAFEDERMCRIESEISGLSDNEDY